MSASFLTYFVVQAEPKILPLAICDNGATVKHNVMALHSIGKMETYEITWEGYVMFAFIGVFVLCIRLVDMFVHYHNLRSHKIMWRGMGRWR